MPVGERIVVSDLDGTLLDSDAALLAPFEALGIDAVDVRMGSVVGAECTRLGVSIDDYVARYDTDVVRPLPGIEEMLAGVARRGVCSNKHPESGHAELRRLGWIPEVVMFTDSFDGALGRRRDTGIPKWGYYMDHLLDFVFMWCVSKPVSIIHSILSSPCNNHT